MTKQIRLFEKTADGLLVEVAPDQAVQVRQGRRCSRMNASFDVLWTSEEEAARDAEEAQAAEQQITRAKMAADQAQKRANALAKLTALGLSEDDVKVLKL